MRGWIQERALVDGTPVFEIGYRVDGRAVKRKAGYTRREAQSALTIALADIETGKVRAYTSDCVSAYAERWLKRRAAYVEPGTIQAYRNDFTYRINPTLGDVRLRDLTPERIEAAVTDMLAMKPKRGTANTTYSPKTVNNTITTFAVMLGTAVSDGLLRENPCVRRGGAGTRQLRVSETYREMRYLMPGEIPRFLSACDPDDYRDLAAVMAFAGVRISEALALSPSEIDTRSGVIRVVAQVKDRKRTHLKNKTPRAVEIGPRLSAQLQTRIDWCLQHGHPMLFPEPDDGGYMDRTRIRNRWHIPALIEAGLDPMVRVHDLRHSAAAAWLIAGGQSLEYVRRQLGHASISQTQKYAHLERAGRSQAADITEAGIWNSA